MSHGGGNQDRWLLTYADLITLLMVFFVVMYAISEADKGKYLQLRSSMQRAFGSVDLDVSPEEGLLSGDGASLLEDQTPQTPVGAEEELGQGDESARVLSQPSIPDTKLEALRDALLPLAEAQGVADNVTVYRSREGVVVRLSGNLLFDSGKAELKPEGALFLDIVADVVHNWPNQLRVEGHTDNVPISTALYPSNWELSAARSVVATRYLLEQRKLSPGRIASAAYGDSRPVGDNNSREGRMRNRRVDVLVLDITGEGLSGEVR